MVSAFHGHAHNQACQLEWHPLYIKGTGHSDGEGYEHVFASSNDLAHGTHHASRFHHHQAIEEHFTFWDQDKYANLSCFIQNHYREAIQAVQSLETEFIILHGQFGITNEEFIQYLASEKKYLQDLTEPSPMTALKSQYVSVLLDLSQCRQEWVAAQTAANQVFTSVASAQINVAINQVWRRVDTAYLKLQHAESYVETLENSLNIAEQWTAALAEYQTYHQANVQTNYKRALDELEQLVVMQLFELTKMSTSGTGMLF
ncbi:hypothetical protein L208DRAFT_1283528 [Tricholoma matsutake]|nr:hypothetical protein L208DRAFT_1283528 [Tricholoma matsutake 945]